jgi:hypothetical protein
MRAFGKRTMDVGQHRSCILVSKNDIDILSSVQQALNECRMQVGQELSTAVYDMDSSDTDRFWPAELHHQLHDESQDHNSAEELTTLTIPEWLNQYSRH